MIIEPRMRGFICLTSHPKGCEQNIINQLNYVQAKGKIEGPKKLKDLYLQQLEIINNNYSSTKPLYYSNIFKPLEK